MHNLQKLSSFIGGEILEFYMWDLVDLRIFNFTKNKFKLDMESLEEFEKYLWGKYTRSLGRRICEMKMLSG